jgi:hypothetical protein
MTDSDHGLVFVAELPAARGHATSAVQTKRAEALRANPNVWARWPTKSSVQIVRKALEKIGPGFEVCMRERRVHARFVDGRPEVSSTDRMPPAGKLVRAKCAYCRVELGEAVDPEELIEIHRANKAVCDRRYKRDGL